jgi:Ulp1 family protease
MSQTDKHPRYRRSERDERIEFLEKEMRTLFNLHFVNDTVVNNYKKLESEWKRLTHYKPDPTPAILTKEEREEWLKQQVI